MNISCTLLGTSLLIIVCTGPPHPPLLIVCVCVCRHKCPCCNTVLNNEDLIKDVGFDALMSKPNPFYRSTHTLTPTHPPHTLQKQ